MDRAQIEAYFDDPKRQEQLVQAISRLVRIRSCLLYTFSEPTRP